MALLTIPAVAAGGGGSSGPIGYVVVAILVIGVILSFVHLRRGGPGPAVNYVPKRLRGRLNSAYQRAGWQRPFDADGNRNRDRSGI